MSVAGARRESRDDPAADRATEPDLEATRRFLRRLDGTPQAFTFQTFSDRKNSAGGDPLARVLHGSLEQHAPRLRQLNRAGAGVFVSVNATDGRGRRTENVERVRALWQEDDGAGQPLPLAPHIVVETSPGHFHRYLLVDGISREEFAAVQQVLVDRYGSDRNAKDLARVLRLPGFFHRKGEPFLVRLVEATDAAPYSREQTLRAFPPPHTQEPGPEAGPEDNGEDWVGAGPDALRDLRSALAWLRADERELWVAVGQALRGLGSAGRGLWIEWSQTSEKWRREDARLWGTFRGNRTDYRAVFAKAQRMGWVNPRAKATPPGDDAEEEQPTATPSGRIDLGDLPEDIDAYVLPPRPWVVKDRLLRGTVSVLASPGGVGKSAFEIASAVSVAGLVPFTGEEVREHGPVWVHNNEDDRDQLLRRYLAFCKHHRVQPSSLRGRLRLSSGAGGHPGHCQAHRGHRAGGPDCPGQGAHPGLARLAVHGLLGRPAGQHPPGEREQQRRSRRGHEPVAAGGGRDALRHRAALAHPEDRRRQRGPRRQPGSHPRRVRHRRCRPPGDDAGPDVGENRRALRRCTRTRAPSGATRSRQG